MSDDAMSSDDILGYGCITFVLLCVGAIGLALLIAFTKFVWNAV